MKKLILILCILLAATLLFATGTTESEGLNEIHFLIPGGAGGGWDSTARGVGAVLSETELIETASYENMSGGGGGVAIAHLISTKASNRAKQTLMVNSTPIITRSLSAVFPQSFRDLVPVARVIADFGAFVVKADSPYTAWDQVVEDFLADSANVKVAGGSAVGSLDHIVAALAFQKSGGDPKSVAYIAYDAGGDAMAALLSGETELLSTGLGEALGLEAAGQVRILAITAPERVAEAADTPTLVEQGYDVTFANWRGFFAPPDTPAEKVSAYNMVFEAMYDTPEWEDMRKKNGWVNSYLPADTFVDFLFEQEQEIGDLMRTLGFID